LWWRWILVVVLDQFRSKREKETYTSTYTTSYSLFTVGYSWALTCGMLHQLYDPYGVPAGNCELLNTKPLVPVLFRTCPKSLIQLFFGAYHFRSTVVFCAAIRGTHSKATTDLGTYMLLSSDWNSVNAVQRKTNI
jgi:hypothetical protein